MTGCLTALFTRSGGLTGSAQRFGGGQGEAFRVGNISAAAIRKGGCENDYARRATTFTTRFGLVCTTGIGEEDILWASDQMVLTIEGNKIYVMA